MTDIAVSVLQQLLPQTAVFLVYAIGMIMALVYLRRCRSASVLVILAAVLLLLSSIGFAVAYQYMFRLYSERVWTADKLDTALPVLGLVSSFIHAVGQLLLIAAAFAGRGAKAGVESTPEKI